MSSFNSRHQQARRRGARHGASRRMDRRASPLRWCQRLDGWLTEPRLNALVDIAVLIALITAGLAFGVTLWLAS